LVAGGSNVQPVVLPTAVVTGVPPLTLYVTYWYSRNFCVRARDEVEITK
jgi:hypothetical protein